MQDLTILIPWREPARTPGSAGRDAQAWRVASKNWIRDRYILLFPNSEILFYDNEEEDTFNRSSFINSGVAQVSTKYVLIADADTIPHYRFINDGLQLLEAGAPWVIPYGTPESDGGYYNLTPECSGMILRRDSDETIETSCLTWEHHLVSWSGQVLMRVADFFLMGGFDERCRGWGYEDNCFQLAADTILGPHERVEDGYALHIWHPAPEETTWNQPHINKNRALFERYQACEGDPKAMSQLVRGGRT